MNMKRLANNLHNIILGLESEFGMKNSKLITLIMFSLHKEI